MASSSSPFSWWTPGMNRNQNADSDTDSEHRRRFTERAQDFAESTTSDDDTLSHVSAADAEGSTSNNNNNNNNNNNSLPAITVSAPQDTGNMDPDSLDDAASDDMASLDLSSSNIAHPTTNILASDDQTKAELTSSDPIDPDGTISEHETRGPELARNGYNHNVDDFNDLYKKLHLRTDFFKKFYTFIKEHHDTNEDVKGALMANTEQGVKDVAQGFLEQYGKLVWKLKGKNCQQDRKTYRGTIFDIKKDEDRLAPILEELWSRVRDLLYTDARPAAESGPSPFLLPVGPWTQYGNRDNPNLRPGPLPAEIPSRAAVPEEWEEGPEEAADIARFLNKVKAERFGGRR